jgi:hypothetical protein
VPAKIAAVREWLNYGSGFYFLLPFWNFAKSDALPTAIGLDELDAGGFQRSAQCSFVRRRRCDFAINDLHATDSCYSDFRSDG